MPRAHGLFVAEALARAARPLEEGADAPPGERHEGKKRDRRSEGRLPEGCAIERIRDGAAVQVACAGRGLADQPAMANRRRRLAKAKPAASRTGKLSASAPALSSSSSGEPSHLSSGSSACMLIRAEAASSVYSAISGYSRRKLARSTQQRWRFLSSRMKSRLSTPRAPLQSTGI